jgi:hypothetical protein
MAAEALDKTNINESWCLALFQRLVVCEVLAAQVIPECERLRGDGVHPRPRPEPVRYNPRDKAMYAEGLRMGYAKRLLPQHGNRGESWAPRNH